MCFHHFYAFSCILCVICLPFDFRLCLTMDPESEKKNKERIIGHSRIVGGGCRRLDFCLGSTVTWKVTKSNGVTASQGPRIQYRWSTSSTQHGKIVLGFK